MPHTTALIERELDITYRVIPGEPDVNYHGEIELLSVTFNGKEIELTPAEERAIIEQIEEEEQ